MTPKKDTNNQDIQFQASVEKMRVEISKNQSDITLEEFDDYFKDFSSYVNNVEFSEIIHGLEVSLLIPAARKDSI